MKPVPCRAAALSLAVLLFLSVACLPSCRNRDFVPAAPPVAENGQGETVVTGEFRCWVILPDGGEYQVTNADALFKEVKGIYEKSDTVAPFAEIPAYLRLIFCTGGTAPETDIPAYQLPNATLCGVYTLFPDDTGWYGDNLVTAHVSAFRLKKGSYEALLSLAESAVPS